jgi:acyl-CoA synthetase (AMP-forming)/AMP-acid ligase II
MRNVLSIHGELRKRASIRPDDLAMKDARTAVTFSELDDRASQVAQALRNAGFKHGDKLAVLLSNRLEWGEIEYGCFRAGVLPAGINFMFAPDQAAHAIESVDADGFLFESEFVDLVEQIEDDVDLPDDRVIELDGDSDYQSYEEFVAGSPTESPGFEGLEAGEQAVIWFTSGTTGQPKPLVWTQEGLVNHFAIHGFALELNDSDYSLLLMPFFHGNSQAYFMCQLYLGGSVYVHRGRDFDPDETLAIIEEEGITFTSMVPTHYNQLIHDTDIGQYDLSALETVLSSSAPLSRALKKEVVETMDCDVAESYGSTEAGMPIMLRPKDQLRKIGSIGTPLSGCEAAVLDEETLDPVDPDEIGEIYMRMPFGMEGYYEMPEKTKEVTIERSGHRWMTAGDMGKVDEDGYFYMVNRKNDMIITGGENVYPSHIEEVLYEHEVIKDVAVIGVPDEKWGETIHAVAIPAKDREPSLEEIREFCRGEVADYEIPKGIDYVDELPRTSTGKILRGDVREDYWDGQRDYSKM